MGLRRRFRRGFYGNDGSRMTEGAVSGLETIHRERQIAHRLRATAALNLSDSALPRLMGQPFRNTDELNPKSFADGAQQWKLRAIIMPE